jgi:hypothetical protein
MTGITISRLVGSRDSRPQAAVLRPTPAAERGRLTEDWGSDPKGESPLQGGQPWGMAEVLSLAERSLDRFRVRVGDYTATLVKQEAVNGKLGDPQKIAIKVQCTHRPEAPDVRHPLRVYLRFESPSNVAGREVIWAEDLHDAKMVVHEAGILGLMSLRLEPTGLIAMQGQRYPITEIGLTNLLEKLVARGRQDLDNPDVSVNVVQGLELEGLVCDRIEVVRRKPSGKADDFSRAEIWFDPRTEFPIRYSAYGWRADRNKGSDPKTPPAPGDLIESYTYLDIRANVGLTEADFDPENPEYQFP